jgi:hypothetical protein
MGAQVITPVTLPSGQTINLPNSAIASQFKEYLASTPAGGLPVTIPTPITEPLTPNTGLPITTMPVTEPLTPNTGLPVTTMPVTEPLTPNTGLPVTTMPITEPLTPATGLPVTTMPVTPSAGLVFNPEPYEGPYTGPLILGGPQRGQYYSEPGSSLTANVMPGTGGFPGGPLSSPTTTSDSIPLTVQERYNKYLSATGPETVNELYKLYRASVDKKANGGAMGLDYLTGMEPSKGYADGGRIGFKAGSGKKIFDIINKTNQELKIKKPKAGEVTTPTEPVKTVEEPRTLGGLPIDERSANISDEIDKLRASGINSLENEKKLNKLSLEFVDSLDPRRQTKALDYRRKSLDTENKLIIKAEEKGLDFDTYEKLRQGLYGDRKQQTLDFIKTGKVNIEPVKPVTTFEEVQNRYRTAAKAADEIFPNYDQPKTAASELANVMAEQKYGKVFDDISGDKQSDLYSEAYDYITSVNRLPKVSPKNVPPQVLEQKMNEVLNTYDKSMFIKNEQGMVDVTNSENIEKMALLLKRDHPELYNRIFNLTDDLNQKEILSDFDVTGRKPNATGGRIGYAEGSDGAPSITLDSHDKAPDNMDKYPIKAGNLELGISGLITGGKNYQSDPYTKLSGSERNISVRGKYNVPNTGVSLLGDIGDVRIKSDRDVNVPQYNYKESIRDILKANPYSVGIEYAPDQNKNINLRYDDQGNVMLRGEYKFAKGGLGYLVGE